MAELPPITERDLAEQAERLRKMPNGGFAWKCDLCNQAASSLTQGGPRCYQHGGTRKRAKDRLEVSKAKGKGKTYRPSGRPLKTGWYSREETVDIQKLVDAYRAAGLNPDATDEDMLHLRARLQRLHALEPLVDDLKAQMETLLVELRAWREQQVLDTGDLTVTKVLEKLDAYVLIAHKVDVISDALGRFMSLQDAIEERHARLIKMAHIRADTRVKNLAAEQLDVFTMMLSRLMLVLSESMAPPDFLALQKRMAKDLSEIPQRALEPHTVEIKENSESD